MQGQLATGIAVFRGIPFAAPPVGALRWREPQPVKKWTTILQTDTAGPLCIQKPDMSLENGGGPDKRDKDCFYLNVFGPVTKPGKRLPVLCGSMAARSALAAAHCQFTTVVCLAFSHRRPTSQISAAQ